MTSKLADDGVPLPIAAVQLYRPESSSVTFDIVRNDRLFSLDIDNRPPSISSVLPTLHEMVEVTLVVQLTEKEELANTTWFVGDETIPGGAARDNDALQYNSHFCECVI